MGAALQRLHEICIGSPSSKPKVAMDTNCVRYYINNPPVQPWADCLDPIFRAGIDGKVELYVSTVVVAELLAHVHFASRHQTGVDPELDLLAILNRHFQLLDVNGDVARAAGRLRGNYVPGDRMALKTPDALIGATSLANGHTLFVTNDAQLADALPEASCIYLQGAALEYLAEQFPQNCLDHTTPVKPTRRGPGLPAGIALATPELGSVKPDPAATWRRLLADAFVVSSALNEPCVFLVLTKRNGRRTETAEVLFWHPDLEKARPAEHILRRVREHLDVRYDKQKGQHIANPEKGCHGFIFTSLTRERARQSQPCYASKSENQRFADALKIYFTPLWHFRKGLVLPQTTWLFCEDGVARYLKPAETLAFLDKAKNVFGWEEGR